MLKKTLLGLLALIVLAAGGFVALAWRSSMAPIEPPQASSFPDALVERGRALAGAGNCGSCHTKDGGRPYAGGRALATDFGAVYSTNITPDPKTGIGRWSEDAFIRAMREGVRRDGAHLYPAFPYTHFAQVREEDLRALYAYFMTREPVEAETPENTLDFPANMRMMLAGWKLMYFDADSFQPDAERSEAWNRGAYLAEGLGHCSACHTPRNAMGAERTGEARYAGAVIDQWYAPALDERNGAPLPWTQAELFDYLRTGGTAFHGVAGGSMAEVVHEGLARLPDADIEAIATYFADMAGAPERIDEARVAAAMRPTAETAYTARERHGLQLYRTACEACHYNRPGAPSALRPALSLNTSVTGPDPTNFIRLVLDGVDKRDGHPEGFMHGFATALDDADLAALAGYLRKAYAAPGKSGEPAMDAWSNLETRIRAFRQRAMTEAQ